MNSPITNLPAILKFDYNWLAEVSRSPRIANVANEDQRKLLNGLAVARIVIAVVAAFSILKGLRLSTLVTLVACHELFALAANYSRKIVANLDLTRLTTMLATENELLTIFNRQTQNDSISIQQGSRESLVEGTLSAYVWNVIQEKTQQR